MIQAAVFGYGNLGQSVVKALLRAPDMRPCGVFTRRAQALQSTGVTSAQGVPLLPVQALADTPAQVVINCGGSAADLPRTTPALAARFCVADTFDTHAQIPRHVRATDAAARAGGTLCVVCAGWDPGLFSLARLLGGAFMPQARVNTFWGPGVSQGHSDALRRLPGVADARQYTLPRPQALQDALAGRACDPKHAHRRVCYVVPQPGADTEKLRQSILEMPHYFAGYEVEVHFLTAEELARDHAGLPHGGSVVCAGGTQEARQTAQLQLTLASNPDLTAGILVACARALLRLHAQGQRGCLTMADIPPAAYSPLTPQQIWAEIL